MFLKRFIKNHLSFKVAFASTFVLILLFGLFAPLLLQMDFFKTQPNTLPFLLLVALFFLCLQFTLTTIAMHIFVVTPLQKLKETMHEVQTGGPLDSLKWQSDDEIGVLYQRYNQMLLNLQRINERKKSIENKLVKTEESLKFKTELEKKNNIIERMNSELTESFNNVALLFTVSQSLNSALDIGELLTAIHEIFEHKFTCHQYALYYTFEESHLRLVSHKGFTNHSQWGDQKIDFGKGLVGQVAQSEKPIYVENIKTFALPLFGLENELHGSIFCVPLIARNRLLGVLSVARSSASAFSSQDKQSIESIATQIANAHDRSILYTQTRELSVRDDLTGVYNRRHFQQVIEKEFKRSERYHRPFSILMVDVDHFKKFNDTYGHLKGDIALKAISNLISNSIREIDIIARYGGEEFILLLPDTALDGAKIVAEKLRQKVENDLKLNLPEFSTQASLPITISIGIASYPDIRSLGELIHSADMALYEAKNQGRNRIVSFEDTPDLSYKNSDSSKNQDVAFIKAKNQ